MGRHLTATVTTTLAMLTLCGAVPGRTQEREETGSRMSVHRAMRILREEGLAPKVDKESAEEPTIAVKIEGDVVGLTLKGCEDRRCSWVSFGVMWEDLSKSPHLSRLNEWNRKYRYARAYFDSKDRLTLVYDVEFAGDDSEDQLKAGLARWRQVYGDFKRFAFE
jgi:hypothetical protein